MKFYTVVISPAPDSRFECKYYITLFSEAKVSIDRIISNEGNGPPRGPNFNAPSGAGGSMFEMMVPGHKVGLIIGKAGETIKQLQEQSGAKIVIIQVSINYSGYRINEYFSSTNVFMIVLELVIFIVKLLL